MLLDNIPKPLTFWYEDKNDEKGTKLTQQEWDDAVEVPGEERVWTQHSVDTMSTESVYCGFIKTKWPVRFLKWLIRKFPLSWRGQHPFSYSKSSSLSWTLPVVEYLVKTNGWTIDEAALVASRLCECCHNQVLHDLGEQLFYNEVTTSCDYCKFVEPQRPERLRVYWCYRTLKLGGDIATAWRECSPQFGSDYWNAALVPITTWDRIKDFFRRNKNEV